MNRVLSFVSHAITAVIIVFSALPAHAQNAAFAAPPLAQWLSSSGVTRSQLGLWVAPVGDAKASFSLNAQTAYNPASVMKLYTTLAGLELLGAAHQWKTGLYSSAAVKNGVIDGDVYFRGGGDPSLKLQDAWRLLHELRLQGVHTINGGWVLDNTVFAAEAFDPASFDGEASRAYNAPPDGALISFNATRIVFVPSDSDWHVAADMLPQGWRLEHAVQATRGACGDWRSKLQLSIKAGVVSVAGSVPSSCGVQSIYRSLGNPIAHAAGTLNQLWRSMGGQISAAPKQGATPAAAKLLAEIDSAPLAEVIRDINKRSNNVMARSLFLSLAQRSNASTADGNAAIRQWLTQRGLGAADVIFENGSGLSRIERSSAAHIAQLLQYGFNSAVMPEFMSSLAVLGQDGTVRNRPQRGQGTAHLKTGTLRDVRSLAGYVQAASGQRYVFVVLINAPSDSIGGAQGLMDNLLNWVLTRG